MKLVVAADPHIAKVWDHIDNVLPKEAGLLNPNEIFRTLIKSLNKDDRLVINGDLVDYYNTEYDGKGSNWKLFYSILNNFKGKTFLNLGNHDYRKEPFNFSIYKLKRVNVSDKTLKKYKNQVGNYKLRWLKEWNSIRVNKDWFDTIKDYNGQLDYSADLGDAQLILLNTGPDAYTRFRNILNIKKSALFYTAFPNSIGLSDEQTNKLKRFLSQTNNRCYILLHCPPFFSFNKINRVRLNKKNYYKTLREHGLTYGSFLGNNWEFIETSINSDRNITVITSHTHCPKQYLINKKSGILSETDIKGINKKSNDPNFIKIVSTMPIGAVDHHSEVGYMTITGGKIKYHTIKRVSKHI